MTTIRKQLGKLTKEQKEQTWKTHVTGSSAKLTVEEPYNRIRDMLDIKRIFKSKMDFFNSEKFKQIGDNAKALGNFYESVVLEEYKLHLEEKQKSNLYAQDITYAIDYFDDSKKLLEHIKVSCTPDFFILDENQQVVLVGDIKNSTSADKIEVMTERYYQQALHNAYVMNCKNFVIVAKSVTTRPLNIYPIEFTQEDFDRYEEFLIKFFENVKNKNIEIYDANVEQQSEEEEQEFKTDTLVIENEKDKESFEAYVNLISQKKEIELAIKTFEAQFKNSYDNLTATFGNKQLIQSVVKRKGNVDYKALLEQLSLQYSLDIHDLEEQFRKEYTYSKQIKIKEIK